METIEERQTREGRETAIENAQLFGAGYTFNLHGVENALDPLKVTVYVREEDGSIVSHSLPTDAKPHTPVEIDPIEGVWVWVCDRCGQPLPGKDATCNSGFHVGPDGKNVGRAIKSTELAQVNWDINEGGRSNSSRVFRQIVGHVARLLQNERHGIAAGHYHNEAQLIVAQLCHSLGMKPSWWTGRFDEPPQVEHKPYRG